MFVPPVKLPEPSQLSHYIQQPASWTTEEADSRHEELSFLLSTWSISALGPPSHVPQWVPWTLGLGTAVV